MQEITKISSRDNARLVRARKVRDGRVSELIFVEGKRLVEEALRSDLLLVECFVSDSFAETGLVERIVEAGAAVAELPSRLLDSIADTNSSQGIILLAERPICEAEPFEPQRAAENLPLYIYLKEANNPSNVGAIVRTAEAAGAMGILLSPRSADPYSPKALRASMGSAFRMPIWEDVELAAAVQQARNQRFSVKAADLSAELDYLEVDWTQPALLVFGSEAHGLTTDDIALTDELVKIELANGVESLNLAVATGILIFEMKRQFRS